VNYSLATDSVERNSNYSPLGAGGTKDVKTVCGHLQFLTLPTNRITSDVT